MYNDLSPIHKGMFFALIGFTGYAFSDVCAKWLAQELSISQTLVLNNGAACVFMLLLLPKLGGLKALKPQNLKLQFIRGLLNSSISFLVIISIMHLPIADVYTFLFAMPFYAAIIAIFLYKEPVSKNRWIAIGIGFLGVVLALKPGYVAFNPWLLCAILAGIVIAIMFTISKSMQSESLFALGFWPMTFNVLIHGVIILFQGFEPISLEIALVCAFNGLCIAGGIVFVSNGFRMAPAAAVSPFLYTEMIWALLLGYLIFGDVPDLVMLGGALIIITSGIYLIETERRAKNPRNIKIGT